MQKSYLYLFMSIATAWAQSQTSPTLNTFPTREFGQPALLPTLNSIAPNLVEGRELYNPSAIAFDTSSTPPILYIADSGNNRVLAYPNPANIGVCLVGGSSSCGFANSTVILGQTSLTATLPGGPGAQSPALSYGFSYPSNLTVDSSGNVYVVDSGNNRILRFPAPFKQPGPLITPDLVIGQASFGSGKSPNQGQSLPTAQTLALAQYGQVYASGIALDATGNLWVSDPLNNRVLRFPVSQLAPNTSMPTADVVLGQSNFTTSALPSTPPNLPAVQFAPALLNQPSALAFDQGGNLYVSDSNSRVLYFLGPFNSGTAGLSATRILGTFISNIQGSAVPPPPNQYQLGLPYGLAVLSNHLFVADALYNRVVEYDVPTNWPAAPSLTTTPITSQFSPPMIAFIGQSNNSTNVKANQGSPSPTNSSLSSPFGLAFLGTDLWVSDYGNQRVLSYVQQSGNYVTASRLVGQLDFAYNAPNLIEGREVDFSQNNGGGLAVDHSAATPHLYVADPGNNRVLGFKDARNIQPGQKADLVLGQTDFYSSLVNSPTNVTTSPTQTGLNHPVDVVVDGSGNLYVADSFNGRVVRYPAPFSQPAGAQQMPNLVLGQANFNSQFFDASPNTMHTPYGVVLFTDGSLGVSDIFHNRVLIFKHAVGADFQSGQAAAIILGQQSPTATSSSSAVNGMSGPAHMGVDTSDLLYVADSGNNRLLVFSNTTNLVTGASASSYFNFQTPLGVAVSQTTGDIFVTTSSNNAIVQLPAYPILVLNSTPSSYQPINTLNPQTTGLAITLDDSDNVIVAEAANRVTFFYGALAYHNAANYNSAPIAPGMLVQLARLGFGLTTPTASAQVFPWPTVLGTPPNDIQVTVNGTPAPLYAVASGYINLQVPSSTPSSGNSTFIVSHPSTGEILAVGQFPMAQFAPGFFTQGALGYGQIAALNDGATVNNSSNPVSRDGTHFISFCLTGGGVFSGGPNPPPADGMPPTAIASTAVQPQISAGAYGGGVPQSLITYSGAGCGFPGGWQVNFTVTSTFPPVAQNAITLLINNIPANIGPNNTAVPVYFATKQ